MQPTGKVDSLHSRRAVWMALVGTIVVVVGVVIVGIASTGLPPEFVDRPVVHDCGEVVFERGEYGDEPVAPRVCLYEAYLAGRPAEIRELHVDGADLVWIVTGAERVDLWVDDTAGHRDLTHAVDCRLDGTTYGFSLRADPYTDRDVCATQFRYHEGHGPPIEEPPDCGRTEWWEDPCPAPPGWAPAGTSSGG